MESSPLIVSLFPFYDTIFPEGFQSFFDLFFHQDADCAETITKIPYFSANFPYQNAEKYGIMLLLILDLFYRRLLL